MLSFLNKKGSFSGVSLPVENESDEKVRETLQQEVSKALAIQPGPSNPDSLKFIFGDKNSSGHYEFYSNVKKLIIEKEKELRDIMVELKTVLDFNRPHPVDNMRPEDIVTSVEPVANVARKKLTQRQAADLVNHAMQFGSNVWYYKDRLGVARGPCTIPILKKAWMKNLIDYDTMVWSVGLVDWVPVAHASYLAAYIESPEVRFGRWLFHTFNVKPRLDRRQKLTSSPLTASRPSNAPSSAQSSCISVAGTSVDLNEILLRPNYTVEKYIVSSQH
mmetsp:Transcript_19326/g.34899  ORF Transcript_19326/g.34899 Transcript_19326/m.34899 type:complete len:275 (-) Transcript_19326:349-1173(-)